MMKNYGKWSAVAPRLFTANGTAGGLVTVASVIGFYQGQKVIIKATGQKDKLVEIKRFVSPTEFVVGAQDQNAQGYTSLTFYTVLNGATIEAEEQDYGLISLTGSQIAYEAYEAHPISAWRNHLVDRIGASIDSVKDINGINRLAVDANITVTGVVAETNIEWPNQFEILNISVTTPNVEQSIVLPANLQRFAIRVREAKAQMQFAFVSSGSGSLFMTVYRGAVFQSGDIDAPLLPLYYQVDNASIGNPTIVEILCWKRV